MFEPIKMWPRNAMYANRERAHGYKTHFIVCSAERQLLIIPPWICVAVGEVIMSLCYNIYRES